MLDSGLLFVTVHGFPSRSLSVVDVFKLSAQFFIHLLAALLLVPKFCHLLLSSFFDDLPDLKLRHNSEDEKDHNAGDFNPYAPRNWIGVGAHGEDIVVQSFNQLLASNCR